MIAEKLLSYADDQGDPFALQTPALMAYYIGWPGRFQCGTPRPAPRPLFFEHSKKRGEKKIAQGEIPLGTPIWRTEGKFPCGRAAPVGAGGTSRPLGGCSSRKREPFYTKAPVNTGAFDLTPCPKLCYNKHIKCLLYRMAGAIRSHRLTSALMADYTIPLRFMV